MILINYHQLSIANSVKALSSFSSPTSNGVDFDVEIVQSNNEYGTLIITLIATKKRELIISGFQTQAQVQVIANKEAVDNYQKLIGNVSETTTKTNKLSSSSIVKYNNVVNFNKQTNANLAIPPSGIEVTIVSTNTDGQQVVTFTISKGVQEASHQITVTGFQTQAQANVNRVKRYLDKIRTTRTKTSNKTVIQVINRFNFLI